MSLPLFLVTLAWAQTADAAASPEVSPATPPAAPPAAVPSSTDQEAPIIEDIAAAAANPDAPPVVTVMMSDRGSGVGTAAVVYRGVGQSEWTRAPLVGEASGGSSLFIARLPDGLQRTGFAYYVEASDRAGNGPATIGSPEEPIVVDKAREPTRTRLERQALADVAPDPVRIHPAFIMLGYGVGILAASGAAGYLIDLNLSQRHLEAVNTELDDPSLTAERRATLERSRGGYEDAILYDTAISAVLGIVGVAGLVTGTALLVATNFE